MNVNGHVLPKYLLQLISEGRWNKPADKKHLEKMIGSRTAHSFNFLDIVGIQRESQFYHLMEDDLSTIYGLASSVNQGKSITDDNILDIDNTVVIAVNEREEVIFLDYRRSSENPRIMLSYWETGNRMKCRVIATDFTSFISQLDL